MIGGRVMAPVVQRRGRLSRLPVSASADRRQLSSSPSVIMSVLTPSRGSFVSLHLRATKEAPEDVILCGKCIQGGGTRCIGGVKAELAGSRLPLIRLRLGKKGLGPCTGTVIDTCHILVLQSRARRLRGPPADSFLEEHNRVNQPKSLLFFRTFGKHAREIKTQSR